MDGKIYILRNTENDKVYIGQTTRSVEDRFKQHKKLCKANSNQLIFKAMKKYGKDKFFVEELESGISSFEELNEKEAAYISAYNSMAPNGYNLSPGGALWRRKPSLSEEEQKSVVLLYEQGLSQREIAKQYGVDHVVIGYALTKAGVKARPKSCHLPDRTSVIKREDLYKMRIVDGLSVQDIAKHYGVCDATVRRAINRFDLKRI